MTPSRAQRGRPTRRRRLVFVLAVVVALALLLAPAALAAAGGGSSGFGGGGGGGGGGGRGVGLYIIIQLLIRIAILGHGLGLLVLVVLAIGYLLLTRVMPKAQQGWSSRADSGRAATRKVALRERRVELAAAEAAEDDPAFYPDAIRTSAARLFTDIQHAWDSGDRGALQRLVARDLYGEWALRLQDFAARGWRNRVALLDTPQAHLVGLHRGSDGDRVVVRIEARLRDYVEDSQGNHIKRRGRVSEVTQIREFWTLTRQSGRWVLGSIEQGAEGAHALEEKIVATPWSDESALRDEALIEGAMADAAPAGTSIAELADLDFSGDARAAALDLSLADARFAPDVLEVAARRAVTAWAQAIDGDDGPLRAIAEPPAVREMLHPGDPGEATRLVVRGPEIEHIEIRALNAAAQPPTMAITVQINGRRYTEDRSTAAVLSGSRSQPTRFTERWTLALSEDPRQPWRIATVDAPVAGGH